MRYQVQRFVSIPDLKVMSGPLRMVQLPDTVPTVSENESGGAMGGKQQEAG